MVIRLPSLMKFSNVAATTQKRRGRPGLTTKATCLTNDDFLQGLKDQEQRKQDETADKEARKIEREEKKREKSAEK